jgi:hypothetical protein
MIAGICCFLIYLRMTDTAARCAFRLGVRVEKIVLGQTSDECFAARLFADSGRRRHVSAIGP